MILITGASGTSGGAALRAALALGLKPRAMYRNAQDAAAAPEGAAVAIADFSDRDSLAAALAGVTEVFIVCGPIPQLVALESNMIGACREAGVRHVVLHSALGAGRYDKSFPAWHAQVETVLRESGLAHSILRPNGFMQNIVLYDAPSIRAGGAFYAALGEARISLVDVRDVGEIAARILAEPEGHAGRVYEINGPEAVSNAEIAAMISEVAGRPVQYVDVPEAAQRESMLGAGMPAWQVEAILALQAYYRTGACAGVDDFIPSLLGRPARRLGAYLQENRDAFAAEAARAAG